MDEKENNIQPIKNRSKLSKVFNVLLVIFTVIVLAIAGVLIYQKRYLTPFWVNGQSMYPTLNQYAVDANGNKLGVGGGSASIGCKYLDYGVMDTHKSALKKVKKFDVVVCKYNFGDENDKIKRIVGMPGETIKFGQGDENGVLYVKDGDEFRVQEQPLANEYIAAGSYPSGEITLGDGEYYVLGDNRAHSSDSRTNGAVQFDWLVGKVVCICAHCELQQNGDSVEPINIKHFIPRFL